MSCFDHHPPPLNAFRQPLLRRLVCTILIVCLGLPAQIWARDGSAGPVSPHIAGNRIAKSVQGSATTTTRYLVDTNNPTGYAQVVEEHESSAALLPASSGSLTTVYAYGHDLISQDRLTQPGTWHLSYYLYDSGGHVRALSTTTAALTDHHTYDAYGILIASTGTTTNNYLYRGEQFDPDLKLYYQRAIYLNAETGRFWTQDTYEGSPGTPASLHKYLYANGDPVGGLDPSGMFSLVEATTVLGLMSLNFAIYSNIASKLGHEEAAVRLDGAARLFGGMTTMLIGYSVAFRNPFGGIALASAGFDEAYAGYIQALTGQKTYNEMAKGISFTFGIGVDKAQMVSSAVTAIASLGVMIANARALNSITQANVTVSAGQQANLIGNAREAQVAWMTNGSVSREIIRHPLYGKTDIDVIGDIGDLIAVGGPAKANNLGALGRVLRIYMAEAAKRGVDAKAYFTKDTPESVFKLARKLLGDENVVAF
jgi:RHS repeat-associated protein